MSEPPDEEQSVADSLATIASGGALVSTGKFLSLGFGFFTQVAMARLLTEANYGEVVLALAVVNITALVAKLGLDDGVMREFPHHEDNPAEAQGVIRASFLIAVGSGLFAGASVFLAAPVIATRIFDNPSLTSLFRIGAVGVPFIVLKAVAVSLARGARDARPHAYVNQLAQPATRLFLIAGLIIAGFGAVGAVAGQIGSAVLATLLAIWLVRRTLPSFQVDPASMYRPVLAFSLPLVTVQGMGFLNSNIDIYMVGYFLPSAVLGVYNIALQLSNLLTAVLSSLGFLLPPMLTRLQEERQQTEMRRTYQVLTKWMTLVGLPVFVTLFFAPELVIGLLFGEGYVPGVLALRILLIAHLGAIAMGLNGKALIALGHNRVVSYIIICQVVVNVAINLLLIPVYGFEGAAIALAVSAVVGDVLGVAILYRLYGVHPFTRAVFTPVAAVIGVGVAGYVITLVAGLPSFLVVPLVGLLYLPIVATLALEPEDEQLLTRFEEHTGHDLTLVRQMFRILG